MHRNNLPHVNVVTAIKSMENIESFPAIVALVFIHCRYPSSKLFCETGSNSIKQTLPMAYDLILLIGVAYCRMLLNVSIIPLF